VFLLGLLAEAGCIIPRIDTAGDDFCCQSIGVIFREQDDATKPRDAYLALRGIKMHEDVSMRGSAEAVCGLLLQKGKVEAKKTNIDLEISLVVRNRKVNDSQPHYFNAQDLIDSFNRRRVVAGDNEFVFLGGAGESLFDWLTFYRNSLEYTFDANFSDDGRQLIVNVGPYEVLTQMFVRKCYVVPEKLRHRFQQATLAREFPWYGKYGLVYSDGYLGVINETDSSIFKVLDTLLATE